MRFFNVGNIDTVAGTSYVSETSILYKCKEKNYPFYILLICSIIKNVFKFYEIYRF